MSEKKTIMVVDDHEDIRTVVSTILDFGGYDCVPMENGKKALGYLSNAKNAAGVSVIILDILMPEMNGLQVLQALKHQVHTRNIPVVMLTTEGMSKDIIKGYNTGADYYITKPFTSSQVLFGLDMVLSQEGEDPISRKMPEDEDHEGLQ